MAFPATHAKRDVIVLQTTRGFASAPNSPRVFLQPRNRVITVAGLNNNRRAADPVQLIRMADKPGCPPVEEMVQRICALFPTAREYDVRQLLSKYHYREAVVVSALQVLKYPLTMPGPAAWSNPMATPPTLARHLPTQYVPPPTYQHSTASQAWSESMSDGRTSKLGTLSTYSNTPMHSPTPPRPNHSPKIKLKYLKSVFPKAEETFLLDLLVGSDNNVNQVTQQLLTLGHEKKDKPAPLTPRRSLKTPPPPSEPKNEDEVDKEEETPEKLVTPEDIARNIAELKELFPDEDETVIQLALESTDFDFEKANIILTNTSKQEASPPAKSVMFSLKPTITMYSLKSSPSVVSTFKDIAGLYSPMQEVGPEEPGFRIKPKYAAMAAEENALYKGPDNANLSDSYIIPCGPQRGLAKGSNSSLLDSSQGRATLLTSKDNRVAAKGPDPNNRQGPKVETRGSLSKFFINKFKRDSARRI